MNKKPVLDETKLTPARQDELARYRQIEDQTQVLQDIALMTQEVISLLDDSKKNGETSKDEVGAVLLDMRESLARLSDKEAPKMPDYAKPVVDAVSKLEKAITVAIKAIDMKPTIDAPQINVETPIVDVDLKGVEKAIKEIPKAFEKAIKLIPTVEIPETDYQPLLDAWEGISEQLVSIENATRMKPIPGSMIISNLSEIKNSPAPMVDYDYLDVQQTSSTVDTFVYKNGGSVGTVIRTVVVTYTSSAKTDIDKVQYS
jgi:hypothetical protein